MSQLDPPTVTMRPPSSVSSETPPSPPPSRAAGEAEPPQDPAEELRDDSRDSGKEREQSTVQDPPRHAGDGGVVEEDREDGDGEGRLRRRKRGRAQGQGPRREARWRALLREWKLCLTLENSGSVARDHLASERTFLAYARTSLTIASTGVALVQLFMLSEVTNQHLERYARPLGAIMIVLGLFTLAIGVLRYFLIQDALLRGKYPVARLSTSVLSFMMLAIVIVVLVIIIIAR